MTAVGLCIRSCVFPVTRQPITGPLRLPLVLRRRHVWGPIPGQENTSTGDASTKKRKRRSRWGEKEETNDEKAIMLMPNEIVLSNGMKVQG